MKAAEDLDRQDRLFAALSHRVRRQILHLLHIRGGRMTGGQIAERFSCQWPTISRHLAVLREAGLVTVRRNGRERIYAFDLDDMDRKLGAWSATIRGLTRQPLNSPRPGPAPGRARG